MQKSNVISFKVCEKTQEMMSEELNWCMRDKTPQYAIFQADEEDTVVTLYESGKAVFQGISADIDANMWKDQEAFLNNGKMPEEQKKKEETKVLLRQIEDRIGMTLDKLMAD